MGIVFHSYFVFKIRLKRIIKAFSLRKDQIFINSLDLHRHYSIVFMEIHRVEHTDIIDEAGSDVTVTVGSMVDDTLIVMQIDEVLRGSDVVGTFTPGSMVDFRKYVSETYFLVFSSVAVGFKLKFGNIQYLLQHNTAVKVTDTLFCYFTTLGVVTTKMTVNGKVRKHIKDMKNFCRSITRSWHLAAPYIEAVVNIDPVGKKTPLQECPERPREVTKLRLPESNIADAGLAVTTERHCARCCTQRKHFLAHSANLYEKLLGCRKVIRLFRKRLNTRRVNQELIRKAKRISTYRQNKADLKRENVLLQKENQLLHLNLKQASSKLSKLRRIADKRSEQRVTFKDKIQSLKLSLEEANDLLYVA
ncbi:hypothetical protein Bpfe_000820 [Biomphalaria pfeifferi]|uniref:Uncharacterized protein n=1 Tax=Biomphalaria pfeifferi TaxID=112525 RepID=A0AAD8CBI6_BIOPF|nr:hypothetical protein Bpfe_000820 [Biomphalaria pfeifferi]